MSLYMSVYKVSKMEYQIFLSIVNKSSRTATPTRAPLYLSY